MSPVHVLQRSYKHHGHILYRNTIYPVIQHIWSNYEYLHTTARCNSAHAQSATHKNPSSPRHFLEIPNCHPNRFKKYITAIRRGSDAHMWMKESHDTHGPIMRSKLGPFNSVLLCDADAIEKFMRQEGKYPERIVLDSWKAQWKDLDQQYGLLLR